MYLNLIISVSGSSPHCSTAVLASSKACYWKENAARPWQQAQMACWQKGGTLAAVESPEIDTFLSNNGLYSEYVFICLFASDLETIHSLKKSESLTATEKKC